MGIGAGNLLDRMTRGFVGFIEQAASGDPQAVLLVLVILGLTLAFFMRLMRVKGIP
jgi:hypothetical protein